MYAHHYKVELCAAYILPQQSEKGWRATTVLLYKLLYSKELRSLNRNSKLLQMNTLFLCVETSVERNVEHAWSLLAIRDNFKSVA